MTPPSDTPSRKPLNRAPPPEDASPPTVCVTRLPEPSRRFAWEIRRMGAIVLERSRGDFATADMARADGLSSLEARSGHSERRGQR